MLSLAGWILSLRIAASAGTHEEVLREAGVTSGLAVHLGTTDRLESALAKSGQMLVQGLTANENAKPNMEGAWKVVELQGDRGRIDLIIKSGIEGNQGRSPSLYTFHGDDHLMIVYPEGGWTKEAVEKQELRKPPTHFCSDGNRNMWILRRNK